MASVDIQEKANFTRLSKLLVDKGTEALRNTLDAIHLPANLPAVLNANRKSLLRLKFRVINDSQWDLLFPPSGNPPDSKTFDVTLLTVLLRNICGFPSPATGWNTMPPDADRSPQANIVRIKLFRNHVYAHVTLTQVDNAIFESLWQKITQALIELNIPQNDVDDLKICPLAPEEEIYVETLKKWKSHDEECMTVLEGLTDNVRSVESSINRLTQITEENSDRIKLCQSALQQQNDKEPAQNSITCPSPHTSHTTTTTTKENDENILRELAKHNFKSKIRGKVKFFMPGTREWLLKQVNEWFDENKHDSRILLLTAGPGFGKSVFAAKVCEDFEKKGKLAASYFCEFSDSNLRDPMMMLQSLASQMCESVAGFKEKLLDQLKRPHKVRNLKDAFGIYLQNPLDELEIEEPSLVVIDGLDESAADDKNEIVNLIADYFPSLPECIKVLVTSRPEIIVAKLRGLRKINLKSNDANNGSDLELYLKAYLPHLADIQANTLARMCQGSFLHAFFVQSELQKRDDLEKMSFSEIINFLPKGLDTIYQAYFKRLEDELKAIMHQNFDVLKILELLVACEGPLPLKFISRALGLASDCRETKKIINKVNEAVSCLLYVSDDQVTIFHRSVIDWLLARGYEDHEYAVKISKARKSVWLICEQVLKEIKKIVCCGHDLNLTNDVKYALDRGLHHLLACKMKESFFWFVDIVIVYVLLYMYRDEDSDTDLSELIQLWVDVLKVVKSDELRARISWHIVEFDFLGQFIIPIFETLLRNKPFAYLYIILTHSPKGYFSDEEKKIAESLLSKASSFVEFNFYDVDAMPKVIRRFPSSIITDVAVSSDKTMAAVAQINGNISVVCVPTMIKHWQYRSTKGISCCTFAPDDSYVLFGKLETVLNIAERKEVPFFNRNKETFTSCAFSPNGSRLVTSNDSRIIKLWDVAKQGLLSSLSAEVLVGECSFSSTGLFIIGNRRSYPDVSISEDSASKVGGCVVEETKPAIEDLFCVWNAFTWQRCDKRNIAEVREPGILRSKKCYRCLRPGFKELNSCNRLEIEPFLPTKSWETPHKIWSTGTYNDVECIFAFNEQSLSVIENTHFTTLAAWNVFVRVFYDPDMYNYFRKIEKINDDLWFYADDEKLFVFETIVPIHEQPSCLPRPTRVLWSSFSPDGSRLATCTSDGFINIWNVAASQVEQSFKCNKGESSFVCWWSEKFLFVFDFFGRIPSLSKYPLDSNLKILFSQSQQVSLSHLVDEFVSLSAVIDFSEGFLSFECGKTKPVKVLNVNGVGGPKMLTLPGIEPKMTITVSPYGTFIFGSKDTHYIWKRTAEEPALYEVLFTKPTTKLDCNSACCYSNCSKVALVSERPNSFNFCGICKIIYLDTGSQESISFYPCFGYLNLFCFNKDDGVVIAASPELVQYFDIESGARLGYSYQRYLTWDSLKQTKLSPNGTVLAFPRISGKMEFLRLCIPQDPLLSSIKRKAATFQWQTVEGVQPNEITKIQNKLSSHRFLNS